MIHTVRGAVTHCQSPRLCTVAVSFAVMPTATRARGAAATLSDELGCTWERLRPAYRRPVATRTSRHRQLRELPRVVHDAAVLAAQPELTVNGAVLVASRAARLITREGSIRAACDDWTMMSGRARGESAVTSLTAGVEDVAACAQRGPELDVGDGATAALALACFAAVRRLAPDGDREPIVAAPPRGTGREAPRPPVCEMRRGRERPGRARR